MGKISAIIKGVKGIFGIFKFGGVAKETLIEVLEFTEKGKKYLDDDTLTKVEFCDSINEMLDIPKPVCRKFLPQFEKRINAIEKMAVALGEDPRIDFWYNLKTGKYEINVLNN